MYEVSDEYTELMNDETSVLDVYVRCSFANGAVVVYGDVIQKIELNERVNDNSNILTLGNACANSVTIPMISPPNLQYKGLDCEPACGFMLSNGTIEWVPLGKFWVDSAKTDDDYNTVKIVAYDKMYKMNTPYTTSLEYPALIEDVVAEFETLAGVKVVKPETFPKLYITRKVEDGKYTLRDMAGHLAGCLGKNATFNRDGDMEFIYYTQTAVKATEDLQYMRGFEKLSDNSLKINFLIIGRESEEEEKIELENDGTDPGALDWRMFDSFDPADFPWLTFTYDNEAMTASVALTDGYENDTAGIKIPYSLLYNDEIYTVTSIEEEGFANCQASEIILPYTLTTIEDRAFSDCTGLTNLTVPESVTSVGYRVFNACSSLKTVYWDATSVASAGNEAGGAFANCSALTEFIIGEGVQTIPTYLLMNCGALEYVQIPASVTSIGIASFGYCTALTSITIPEGVTTVSREAFRGCSSLKTVYWDATSVASAGNEGGGAFAGCSALTDFIVGNGVQIVPAHVVRSCGALEYIHIPNSVTSIGTCAFAYCTALTSVTIPASVTSVGNRAFHGCSSLKTVYWNAISVASVGNVSYTVFYNCSAITELVIGQGVQTIPSYMVKGCTGIKNVYIPNSVTSIGSYAFNGCSALTDVQIGSSADCQISSIATNAFGNDAALNNITIYRTADAVSGSPWGAANATVNWIGE